MARYPGLGSRHLDSVCAARSPQALLMHPAATPPYTHVLDSVKDCSTRVRVKMCILIVKRIFCKYSYSNLSAHSVVQIHTDTTYTEELAVSATEQSPFKQRPESQGAPLALGL